MLILNGLPITARQYGEVVLPDAASGNCPGTPPWRGHETVPVQGGYGALFAVRVQNFVRYTRVAVQFVSKPEIYHGAEVYLRADAGIRIQRPLQICLRCRSKSKKCDKQLTHIVRVMGQALLFVSVPENCQVKRYFFYLIISSYLS